MNKTFTRLVAVGLCVVGVACTRLASTPPEPAESAETHKEGEPEAGLVRVDPGMLRDLRITTQPVELRSGADEVTLLGELGVDERAYAEVATPVAARVTRLLANPGDAVAAGGALAQLSSAELGRARADYLSAMAQVRLAESTLERKRELAAEKIAPVREVQEAEAAVADARGAQRAALAALAAFGVAVPTDDSALDDASSFTLRTPVRGSVIERRVVVGQIADPGTPAFRIGNLSTLWLTAQAFERDAVRIVAGATARINFSALPGQDFGGKVAYIGRQVDVESRTIPIRINVENRGGLLRPGMSATARVPAGETGAAIFTVPVASVQRVRNEWCVFLRKDEGSFEIRTIGRGRDLGGEVEVLSGLKAGETIVVDGAFLLKAQAEKGTGGHDEH
jgi:cobalt-zinc-cadmium efflux system membrane fusion protein